MDESLKSRYIAEAKFLRTLHYFNLVHMYGDVPIVTAETASLNGLAVSRDPVDKVYELILADLTEAETVLPKTYPASESGRATQGVAKGIIARVYLARAGTSAGSPCWAQAAAKAKEVTDLGVYDLYANFADTFALTARGGKENIFEIQWDKTAKTLEGTSIPILRYADVLLMYAEAANEANNGPTADAYSAVNKVRTRAGLVALSGLAYQSFKESVWHERRLELPFENMRRYDSHPNRSPARYGESRE